MNQQPAKEKIKKLLDKFNGLSEKERNEKNEEQTKNEFIRPFFEALGWDFEQDVLWEANIQGKRADYTFKIKGITKFYVEAKPIRADLDLEAHSKQAINYAWNKGVNWAVLTDFESIKVFNALGQSKLIQDKLIFEIPYGEYLTDFDRIWLLSKEGFLNNALNEYAVKHGKKLKPQTVNEKLFNDLKIIREKLTKSFKTWNDNLTADLLEEGVQRIIDRLVFIRVLEDRGLENPILLPILRQWEKDEKRNQLFPLLIGKFRELNDTYNSNLFEKHACEDWEEHDDWLKKAILMLYSVGSMYEYNFKEIPADILGGVYESYLSYISKSPSAKGKEDKSEIKKEAKKESRKKRKEQGIFYTPKFIVDYIVENTLGKKLAEAKSIGDLKKIKVLDPACGSGSFLTKALALINDKYRDFGNPADQFTKTEILVSNIYGVDLDSQAVELAKLNLLIGALDKKAKLPDLTENIRNGNSLVSGDEKELKEYFGNNWRDKKPFNWEEEFEAVFKNGGFDVIIGNPPWGADIDEEAKYFEDKYPESTKSYKDSYKIFIDQAINLLKSGGCLGFIVPNTFLYQPRYQDIKDVVNNYENFVVNLGEKIFHGVNLPSCILILMKNKGGNKFITDLTKENRELLPTKIWGIDSNKEKTASKVLKKIYKDTGFTFDDVFLLKDAGIQYASVGAGKSGKGKSDLPQRIFSDKKDLVFDTPFYTGSNINRNGWIIDNKIKTWFRSSYKDILKDGEWVHFTKMVFDRTDKIVWRQTADALHAAIMDFKAFFGKTIHAALVKDEYYNKINLFYALAIFNSKYIDYLYKQKVLEVGKVFPQVKLKYLRDLPFVIANKKDQSEIADLAKQMIKLNKELCETPENSDKWESIKKEIEKTDREIDQKVYALYGLSKEEIKAVEGK